MRMSSEVFIIAGLMVLAILFLMAMFARLYRKAGPHEALVVYGFRGTRIVKGRGTVIFPMVESYRELSLELMSFDVAPQQDLYTKQGVAVTVEAVAQIKVKSDPESILTAAEQFLTKTDQAREALIRLVMEGHLRGIIGQLSVEQIVKEPEMVGDRMRATCADDMNKMGLEVISFTIKEVRDKNEYITNMGRPDVARIKRDADVAAAEAERDTAIKRAEARGRPPSRRRRPTRSACWRRRCRRPSRPKRSAIWKSRRPSIWKPSRSSRRRPTKPTTSRQHHAAAGDGRAGQDPADRRRKHEIKVQEAEIQRRERELIATVLKQAEIERQRIETLAAAEKHAAHGRSRRPRGRDSRAGRSRSRNHPQERRSRSQGHEREGRGLPGIQPGGGGRQAASPACRKW